MIYFGTSFLTMKNLSLFIFYIALLFFAGAVFGQGKLVIQTAGKRFELPPNMEQLDFRSQDWVGQEFQGKLYSLLLFDQVPQQSTQDALQENGISLLSYMPVNGYLCRIPALFSKEKLISFGVKAVYPVQPEWKISQELTAHFLVPERALKGNVVKVVVVFSPGLKESECIQLLKNDGFTAVDHKEGTRLFEIGLPFENIKSLAARPYVEWVEAIPPPEVPNNLPGVNTHRAGILNSSALGQRNLKGEGVTVGVGDGGYVRPHMDFNNGRLVNMFPPTITSFTDHGDHVAGTVGGAGILNPFAMGMAPACTILTRQTSDIVWAGPSYLSNFGMVLTNNSYGFQIACPTTGNYSTYTGTSNAIDNQLRNNPKLLHCFAASNDGGITPCGSYSGGFGTISLGYGTTKNALIVGAVSETDALAGFSSRGPTADGRVKPEICGVGSSVLSTIPNNTYGTKSGTSMATPGVVGTMALLVQRFRQLNGGQNPDAALLKAVVCNTADDLGNANVDFRHGYGRINALRAVQTLENNRYYSNSISQGNTQDVTLAIPAGISQVRVMLYWHDREATSGASPSLVNNLNLQVIDPASTVFDPWVLDPAPANCNNLAVRGVDNLNNIEQVTINNPAAGNYTLRVTAPSVPFGPQSYYVVYENLGPSLSFTYPVGGEILPTTAARNITWNVAGLAGGNLILEYTLNGGASWITINNAIAVTTTRFSWNPGAAFTPTNNIVLRIRHSASSVSATTQAFTLAGWPVLTGTACDRHAYLSWPVITGATGYQIFHFPANEPVMLSTVTANSFSQSNLTNGIEYFYAVRPVFGGGTFTGLRSAAVRVIPAATAACPVVNDVGIFSISPTSGRQFTSTALSASQNIQVTIKNYGTGNQTGVSIPIFYRINGGPIESAVFSGTLATNTVSTAFTFPLSHDFSAPGSYNIEAWTDLPGDANPQNNLLVQVTRQLANPPVNLPVTENFEAFQSTELRQSLAGISGSESWDFSPSTANSRYRTNAFRVSGNRGVTLDRAFQSTTSTINHLIYTLNLSNHATASRLLLNFDYIHHNEEVSNANDRVWVRGTDAQAWVQVYDLFANQAPAGQVRQVRNLDVKALLGGQTIGSSFQIRFGHEGVDAAVNSTMKGGYTFDNVLVIDPGTDVSVNQILSPAGTCLSGNVHNLTVRIQNPSSQIVNNLPIAYQINGGAVVSATVPTLAANSTFDFTFPVPLTLTGGNVFGIRVWTTWAGPIPAADLNPLNDTVSSSIAVTIGSFPWLESFETNNGGFRIAGTNPSWAWGVPNSSNAIMKAAPSGTRIWATNLNGAYNVSENSSLTSPCYNLSAAFDAANLPTLSFSMALQTEVGYDFGWVEYSTDGSTWTKLGLVNGPSSTNWYNRSLNQTWEGELHPWRVASYVIPAAAISNTTQFRIVLTADNSIQGEGIGIDDFHIVPNQRIHNVVGDLSGLAVSSTGSGNWLYFTNGLGERIAGIRDVENMGTVTMNLRQLSSSARQFNNVFYLNRNFSINPTIQPSGAVPVRLFFLDTEVSNLRASDANLASYLGMKVSKYSGPSENLTLDDNQMLLSNFQHVGNPVLVPYHNGYYAEFPVSGFSEFYLAGDSLFQEDSPLPLIFGEFSAKALPKSALLTWSFLDVQGVSNLKLEKSFDGKHFTTIESGMELEVGRKFQILQPKEGQILYFRLSWDDENGISRHSPVRMVRWKDVPEPLLVYPNPSEGTFYLRSGTISGSRKFVFSDALGRSWTYDLNFTNGQTQLDLSGFSKGLYFLRDLEENRSLLKLEVQ